MNDEESQPGGRLGPDPASDATGDAGPAADDAAAGAGPDAARASGAGEPSEAELRAAYEAELSRISSADMMLQATVSLLNIGRLRLGAGGGQAGEDESAGGGGADLEQVRDAIDGTRALLDVLDRRFAKELAPLRDALSQLQLAYAREAGAAAAKGTSEKGEQSSGGSTSGGEGAGKPEPRRPGPAETSGRLWIPGR